MNNTAILFMIFLLITLTILSLCNMAQNHWEDPKGFEINREEMRASFYPFENKELVLKNEKNKSQYIKNLHDWAWMKIRGLFHKQ